MENTIENKRLFVASHWGQHIFNYDDGSGHFKKLEVSFRALRDCNAYDYLSLRDVKSITDSECIEFYNYLFYTVDTSDESKIEYIRDTLKDEDFEDDWGMRSSYDFLRSKGFAVPFMGMSIDKLVEYRWIKLEENA